jgi:hypothetical protein
MLSACTDTDDIKQPDAPATYSMQLEVTLTNYKDVATRATTYSFVNNDVVYVLFTKGSTTIKGTAVYNSTTRLWTITSSQSLAETYDGSCRLAFLLDAGSTTQNVVNMTQQTRLYTDDNAVYEFSGNTVKVKGTLSPALGRIRFRGASGQKCTVSGLAFAYSFNLDSHTLNIMSNKFSATCASNGYTPYYYGVFADASKRALTFEIDETSGYRRALGATALQPGSSGYVIIPTADSHQGWTLINLKSGDTITYPSVGTPTASDVSVNGVSLTATVTATGGGNIKGSGFVIAIHRTPTVSDRNISCGTATSLSAQLTDLQAQTTYYVRAYATNEAGVTYSQEISFTTDEEQGQAETEIDRDGWDSDDDWNDYSNDNVGLDRETYPDDEDWN